MERIGDISIKELPDHWFDLGIALWTWLSENHEGQNSSKYAFMSNMGAGNMPALDENDEELEIAYWMYQEINEDNWEEVSKLYEAAYEKYSENN